MRGEQADYDRELDEYYRQQQAEYDRQEVEFARQRAEYDRVHNREQWTGVAFMVVLFLALAVGTALASGVLELCSTHILCWGWNR